MAKLWFENVWEEERVIAENCSTWQDVHAAIQSFLDECQRSGLIRNHFSGIILALGSRKMGVLELILGHIVNSLSGRENVKNN